MGESRGVWWKTGVEEKKWQGEVFSLGGRWKRSIWWIRDKTKTCI